MTGDMGEIFNALREKGKAKRARNRDMAQAELRRRGIPFTVHNDGAHLVVAERYDFWPGTGLWRARGDRTATRGIRKLIRRIQETAHVT